MIANPMPADQILRLPPLIDIPTACRALGISRSLGYELARTGDFPIDVLRVGDRVRRVRSADLRELIGLQSESPPS